MNFNHLSDSADLPSQDILQRYSKYLIIVVLSDEMKLLVMESVVFNLQSADDILCQIILPEHLELAPKGSMLSLFFEQLQENKVFPNTHHSFIAVARRDDFLEHPCSGGNYYPLMLGTIYERDEKIKLIREKLVDAFKWLRSNEPSLLTGKNTKGVISLISDILKLFRAIGLFS